jgi:hypothetical protein
MSAVIRKSNFVNRRTSANGSSGCLPLHPGPGRDRRGVRRDLQEVRCQASERTRRPGLSLRFCVGTRLPKNDASSNVLTNQFD